MILHSPHNRQAGVTLLEAMIVLVILTLVMGIAGASYKRLSSNQITSSKGFDMLSERLQTYRLKAIAQNKTLKLELADILPPNINLCAELESPSVIFYENGTVALGRLCIQYLDGSQKVVAIDWTNGAITLAD